MDRNRIEEILLGAVFRPSSKRHGVNEQNKETALYALWQAVNFKREISGLPHINYLKREEFEKILEDERWRKQLGKLASDISISFFPPETPLSDKKLERISLHKKPKLIVVKKNKPKPKIELGGKEQKSPGRERKSEPLTLKVAEQRKKEELINKARAIILVDVPNLVAPNWTDEGGYPKNIIDLNRIDWRRLRQALVEKENLELLEGLVYVTIPPDWWEIHRKYAKEGWSVYQRIIQAGLKPVSSEGKHNDIDFMLIFDIGVLSETIFKNHKNIVLILISGDGHFAYPLEKMKEKAKMEKAKLKVKVISWGKGFSHKLRAVADEVIVLEGEILKVIDPVGYANLKCNEGI